MPYYLNRFTYSPEAWSKLIAHPADRTDAVREVIEKAGGELHGFFYAFGAADGYILAEFPGNVGMAAAAALAAASGTDKTAETTVLLTPDEMVQALSTASSLSFRGVDGAAETTP